MTDVFELEKINLGLLLEGHKSVQEYNPEDFITKDVVKALTAWKRKGGRKEDVAKVLSPRFLKECQDAAENCVLGDAVDYRADLLTANSHYALGRLLHKTGDSLENNDLVDLLPIHGQLTSALAGQSTGLTLANQINYHEYKPFMKSGYAPVDAVIGGWPSDGPIVVYGSQGTGKCLAKGTKVVMYDGSLRKVEEIRVGDKLMGIDSSPRTVMSLGHGKDNMYKVTPVKGDSYVVNSEHILSLRKSGTETIINIPIKDYIKSTETFKSRTLGWRSGGVEFQKQDVPIDPYFLGLWLGDGDSHRPAITNVDKEIIDYWHSYAEALGYVVHMHKGNHDSYLITSGKRGGSIEHRDNKITNTLRDMKVLNNKHIPDEYVRNSSRVRMQLLAGLIDTDGYLQDNCYYITLKSESMIDSIVFMARSLGLAAYKKTSYKTCVNNQKIGKYYKASISGDINIIPTKVQRKQASPRQLNRNVLNTHIDVVSVGVGEYYGFTLDKDSLFLLEDFTVTHNSFFGANAADCFLDTHKKETAGIYTLEMSAEHYMYRSVKMYPRIEKHLDRLYVSGSVRNVDDLVAEVTTKRLDFVVIDDMDRIVKSVEPSAYQVAYFRLAEICRFLKIPIMVLAQPNRAAKVGNMFLRPFDISWSSAGENSAAMLIALQVANSLDMDDDIFPLEDENHYYMIFWKSRDGWPIQQGPGAIRLDKANRNQLWSGVPYMNKLFSPVSAKSRKITKRKDK